MYFKMWYSSGPSLYTKLQIHGNSNPKSFIIYGKSGVHKDKGSGAGLDWTLFFLNPPWHRRVTPTWRWEIHLRSPPYCDMPMPLTINALAVWIGFREEVCELFWKATYMQTFIWKYSNLNLKICARAIQL